MKQQTDIEDECTLHYYDLSPVSLPDPADGRLSSGPNSIDNRHFRWWNLIPLVIWTEFHHVYNIFFLLNACTQLVPAFRVGSVAAAFMPMVLILVINIVKEAVDDLRRLKADNLVNNQPVWMLCSRAAGSALEWRKTEAARLKDGAIIALSPNSRVPADVMLLSGSVRVLTDAFDGEPDLKRRDAPHPHFADAHTPVALHRALSGCGAAPVLRADPPSLCGELTVQGTPVAALTSQSLICAEMTMGPDSDDGAFQPPAPGAAIGLVVGTGERQAIRQHRPHTRLRLTAFDERANNSVKISFLLVFVLASVFAGFWPGERSRGVAYMRYVVLFSNIIPNSLAVSLTLLRITFVWSVSAAGPPDAVMRSTDASEQLATPDVVVLDKTGTLTANQMVARALDAAPAGLGPDDDDCLLRGVGLLRAVALCASVSESTADDCGDHHISSPIAAGPSPCGRRARAAMVRAFSFGKWPVPPGLSCTAADEGHTAAADVFSPEAASAELYGAAGQLPPSSAAVTPARYLSASPDESALVAAAAAAGVRLLGSSDAPFMRLVLSAGAVDDMQGTESWKRLAAFEFDPALRRSGLVVRAPSGEIFFIVKGAESAVVPAGAPAVQWAGRHGSALASRGLRVLLYAGRAVSDEEWAEIEPMLLSAAAVQGRARLEAGPLALLGVTGVEDRLAAGAAAAVAFCADGGCNVWMATGDRAETAAAVATAAGLGSFAMPRLGAPLPGTTVEDVEAQAERGEPLLVSGELVSEVLGSALSAERRPNHSVERLRLWARRVLSLPTTFEKTGVAPEACSLLRTLLAAPGLAVYRAAPAHKAALVEALGLVAGCRTLAAGDGANDVPMLGAADVGVGLTGAEGRAAARAADLALPGLAWLGPAMGWHGRQAALGAEAVSLLILHRGMIISVVQACFSVAVKAPENYFDPWLLLGFATIFTGLSTFTVGLGRSPAKGSPAAGLASIRASPPMRMLTPTIAAVLAIVQGLIIYFVVKACDTSDSAAFACFASMCLTVVANCLAYGPELPRLAALGAALLSILGLFTCLFALFGGFVARGVFFKATFFATLAGLLVPTVCAVSRLIFFRPQPIPVILI